jgi:hypothetical protein
MPSNGRPLEEEEEEQEMSFGPEYFVFPPVVED